jgi:ArsR family transcriptional regulator, arsenate/arsenite/antimonite-responsive transcriptional repressor
MNDVETLTQPQWVVKALGALAQINRLNVFRLLVVAGQDGMYPGDMSANLGVSANSLSFHLKELLHCELVSQEREGRNLRYRANMTRMQSLLVFLTDECCQGQACVELPTIDCGAPDCDSKVRNITMNA